MLTNHNPWLETVRTSGIVGADLGEDDLCTVCHNGGNLICCETCPRVFHASCLDEEQQKRQIGDAAFFCTDCMEQHSVECVWCGKTADSDSRLLLCATCPRSFHYACLFERGKMRLQKVPESSTRPLMTLGDDGVWQCDVCADCKLGESQSEKGVGDTMDQILKLCAKLPPQHCASVFGSRMQNIHTIETEFEARKKSNAVGKFSSGQLSSGGDMCRAAARLHHQLMELKYAQDPETDKKDRCGPERAAENSCEEWQAFLQRTQPNASSMPLVCTEQRKQFVEQGLCPLVEGLSKEQVRPCFLSTVEGG